MLTLNISQQNAKINITTARADMRLSTTRPQLMIDTKPAVVEISQPKGELEIDWEPFWASIGLKTPSQFSRDYAELGRQTALETIGRIAQDGDRMAAIESKEDAMVAMAADSTLQPAPEVVWAHLEPPTIHYTARQPVFKPSRGSVNYNFVRGILNMDYQPAQVNISMAQYQSVKMWVTDSSIDINA